MAATVSSTTNASDCSQLRDPLVNGERMGSALFDYTLGGLPNSDGRRGGRPPNHILLPGLSSKPTADVSLYPSRDGSRLTRDAPSPTKKRKSKRQRIDPKSLEDDFADWTPGIATEQVDEQEDQTDGTVEGTEPPPSGVVVNVVAVQRRARYLSSVSLCSLYVLYGILD
ncbi:hypothetical protein HWV62_23913 [Athelia sp. TMB]|nr:hypothetical protein HWV62_23913 [Athelia sp. TMB]